jgi:hypothetical protein
MKMGAILLSSNSTLNTLEGKPRTLPQLKLAYKNMFALLYQTVSLSAQKKQKLGDHGLLYFQQGAHPSINSWGILALLASSNLKQATF